MTVIAMFIEYLGGRVVPRRGLEPPRPYRHQHLKLARLPFRHLGRSRETRFRAVWWACQCDSMRASKGIWGLLSRTVLHLREI